MGVRERGVCDVRRDAHGRRLQRGWLGFFPTPLPGAFDWMLSGDGSISREYDTQRYSSEDWRRRSAGCSGVAAGSHAASPGLPGRLAKAGCAGFPA